MTSAPATRRTHVIRILFTNKNGDVIPDKSVDIERMDTIKSVLAADEAGSQGLQRKLRWHDDPDSDDYEPDGNPARKTKIVKVCDLSEANLDDPEEWAPVPVIVGMKQVASHDNYQGQVEHLIDDDIESRVVEVRRIFHFDTNIDDDADAAFAADPTLKAYVVPGDQYTRDDDSKDDSQYVEHEVVTYLKQRGNSVDRGKPGDQGRQVKLLNQYLIDESEKAELKETGEKGFNPPYRLDPYQNIRNVNFGGLAAEFFQGESWLEADVDLDLSRATMAIWFRVPTEAAEAVRARDAAYHGDPGVLNNVVPVIMFGRQRTGLRYKFFDGVIGEQPSWTSPYPPGNSDPASIGYTPIDVIGSYENGVRDVWVQPSCIGVYVGGDGTPKLFLHLQAGNTAKCTNTSNNSTFGGLDETNTVFLLHADESYADAKLDRAFFGNQDTLTGPEITLDHWHALLISWNVSGSNASRGAAIDGSDSDAPFEEFFTATSNIYCAVDGVNKNGGDLPAFLVGGGGGPNSTALGSVVDFAGGVGNVIGRTGGVEGDESATFNQCQVSWSGSIPSSPIWLPAPATLKRTTSDDGGTTNFVPNQHAELAELQIFSGLTVDTADIGIRQLFITEDGEPAKPSVAEQALGKPDILIHGSGHWKSGTNTGRVAIDFGPSGKIKKYKPDPSLNGPQFPTT